MVRALHTLATVFDLLWPAVRILAVAYLLHLAHEFVYRADPTIVRILEYEARVDRLERASRAYYTGGDYSYSKVLKLLQSPKFRKVVNQ